MASIIITVVLAYFYVDRGHESKIRDDIGNIDE